MSETAPIIQPEAPAIEPTPREEFEQALQELYEALDAHMEAVKSGDENAKKLAKRAVDEASVKVNSKASAANIR